MIRLLGKGGMGAVYQAWDEELGVGVALKVILTSDEEDQLIAEEMKRRFKKELILARQITHRNVVRIHDISEVDGIKFISMPYIKGQDVATILKSGPLSVARALSLARQIVSGLGAAHDAGVVHRDLKPANIMVEDDDHALLMDFGIARSVNAGSTGRGGTIQGTVVGTVEYMAPEQARGATVDGRADIYAVGLIVYEMLTGRRHLTGDGAVSDLVARMHAAPPPVRAVKPEIPEGLDAIVTKCLQPVAGNRYQNCAELAAALDTLDNEGLLIPQARPRALSKPLIAAGVTVLIGLVGSTYWVASRRPPAAESATGRPVSVLIADFDNRTRDAVFDGTLSQSLNLAVEAAPFVATYPRSDALRLASQIKPGVGLDEDVSRLIARREGINVVLAGTITYDGNRYSLAIRALDGATAKEISAAQVEAGSKDDVLPAVSKLAASARRALGDATPEAEQIAAAETFTAGSLEAAHEYAMAQDLFYAGKQQDALQAYLKVTSLDPSLGRAYAGLAALSSNMGRPEDAERYYQQAVQRLDNMSERERYRTLSSYHLLKREHDQALQELETLIRKYPADTAALSNIAFAYFLRRDMSRALQASEQALKVYPKTVFYLNNHALYAMYAGQFDAARDAANRVLEASPGYPKSLFALALSSIAASDTASAHDRYQEMAARNASLSAIGLADLALYSGRAQDALPLLERGVEVDIEAKSLGAAARKLTALAEAHAARGDARTAAAALKRALALSTNPAVVMEAAEVYIALNRIPEASALAGQLNLRLDPDSQAYVRVIEGEILRTRRQPREAVRKLLDAQRIADTWTGQLALGRAYLDLEAWTEAYSSLSACLARQGEGMARFLDDVPTARAVPVAHYYLGRAQQGLGSPAAAQSFRMFLSIRSGADDPLVADARNRAR